MPGGKESGEKILGLFLKLRERESEGREGKVRRENVEGRAGHFLYTFPTRVIRSRPFEGKWGKWFMIDLVSC